MFVLFMYTLYVPPHGHAIQVLVSSLQAHSQPNLFCIPCFILVVDVARYQTFLFLRQSILTYINIRNVICKYDSYPPLQKMHVCR